MNRRLLTLAITTTVDSLLSSDVTSGVHKFTTPAPGERIVTYPQPKAGLPPK